MGHDEVFLVNPGAAAVPWKASESVGFRAMQLSSYRAPGMLSTHPSHMTSKQLEKHAECHLLRPRSSKSNSIGWLVFGRKHQLVAQG